MLITKWKNTGLSTANHATRNYSLGIRFSIRIKLGRVIRFSDRLFKNFSINSKTDQQPMNDLDMLSISAKHIIDSDRLWSVFIYCLLCHSRKLQASFFAVGAAQCPPRAVHKRSPESPRPIVSATSRTSWNGNTGSCPANAH